MAETNSPKPALSHLSLRNFGRFESVDLRLTPLTILIGPNDSGKSTILRALTCLSCELDLSFEDVRRDANAPTERVSEVRIEGVLENASEEIRRQLKLLESDPTIFAMTWEIEGSSPEDIVVPKKPRYEVKSRFPLSVDLRIWPKGKDLQNELLSRIGVEPGRKEEDRKAQWEEARNKALSNSNETVLDWEEVAKDTFLKYLPRIESISASDISSPQSLLQKLLSVKARSIVYPEEPGAGKHRIDRLREIEEKVEANLNEDLKSLTSIVEKHLPGLSSIRVRPQWDFVQGADFSDVIIERNGEACPLGELGAGSSSRCALAMLEWATDMRDLPSGNARLRTMDEPDHRLHFDAQRRLVSLLRRDVEDRSSALAQCVVATHSLTMLDAVSLDQVIYVPEKLTKGKVLSPLLTRNELMAKELLGDIQLGLGLPASWVFLEKAIVVVEGATELEYVRELYHVANKGRTLVEDGVRVWDSQGCGNVVNAVARLVEGGRAAVFVVLDSDAKTRHVSGGDGLLIAEKALNDTLANERYQPRVAWLGQKELEDEWMPSDLALLAEQNWQREDGRCWETKDFEGVASSDKPSEMITDLIKRGARSNLAHCQKPRKEYVAKSMARLPGAHHPQQLVDLLRAVSRSCQET